MLHKRSYNKVFQTKAVVLKLVIALDYVLIMTFLSFTPLRFYFKKVSDEFDCGVVFEEVREDDAVLPIFEEKIIGKVEKVD